MLERECLVCAQGVNRADIVARDGDGCEQARREEFESSGRFGPV